jgi:hypothetical protein
LKLINRKTGRTGTGGFSRERYGYLRKPEKRTAGIK